MSRVLFKPFVNINDSFLIVFVDMQISESSHPLVSFRLMLVNSMIRFVRKLKDVTNGDIRDVMCNGYLGGGPMVAPCSLGLLVGKRLFIGKIIKSLQNTT